jgi:response regulator RpfG family c-di-GMP phosphodiesterase
MDRIMLVSRDMQLTMHLRELLSRDYQLEVHADPAEALRRATSGPIDLVIADSHAAGLSCKYLLAQIRRSRPHLACLTLGRIDDAPPDLEGINPIGIDRVLLPPYDESEFKRVVRQALKAAELRASLGNLSKIQAGLRGFGSKSQAVGAMAKLEAKYPGITRVEWDESNSTYQTTEWSTGFSPLIE